MEDAKFEFLVFQGSPIDMVMRLMADGIEVQTQKGTFLTFILNWPTHPRENRGVPANSDASGLARRHPAPLRREAFLRGENPSQAQQPPKRG